MFASVHFSSIAVNGREREREIVLSPDYNFCCLVCRSLWLFSGERCITWLVLLRKRAEVSLDLSFLVAATSRFLGVGLFLCGVCCGAAGFDLRKTLPCAPRLARACVSKDTWLSSY